MALTSAHAGDGLDFLVVILVLVLVREGHVSVTSGSGLSISNVPNDSRVSAGARSDGEAAPVEAAVVEAGEGAAPPHGHRLDVIPVPVVDRVPPLEHDLGHN